MPFKREESDVEEAGKANPIGVLWAVVVFKQTEQNRYNGTSNQAHSKNRCARLGELTQILHRQGPECWPHQRTTQSNYANAKYAQRAR